MDIDDIFGFLIGSIVGVFFMGIIMICYTSCTYNEVRINNRTCYEIEEKIYCEWSED